jgi:hypothetical protein
MKDDIKALEAVLVRIEELILIRRTQRAELERECQERERVSRGDAELWCYTMETMQRYDREVMEPLRREVTEANRVFDKMMLEQDEPTNA